MNRKLRIKTVSTAGLTALALVTTLASDLAFAQTSNTTNQTQIAAQTKKASKKKATKGSLEAKESATDAMPAIMNASDDANSATATSATTTSGASATAAVSGSTTATTEEVAPKSLKDSLSVSASSLIVGPAVSNMASGKQADGSGVLADNAVAGAYKIGNGLSVGPVVRFKFQAADEIATLKDPYVRFANSKFMSLGDVNVSADVRYYVPFTDMRASAATQKTSLGSIASKQVTSYEMKGSRFSFNLITFVSVSAYRQSKDKQTRLSYYAAPGTEYRLAPNLAATLYYYGDGGYARGNNGLSWGNHDIEPGVSWDITSSLNANPYLIIIPSTSAKEMRDTLGVAATLSLKVL